MSVLERIGFFLLLIAAAMPAQATTFAVLNTNNSGFGSLRQAVLDANASPGADLIIFDTFNVFSVVRTIEITSTIHITDPVTIDAPAAAGRRVTVKSADFSAIRPLKLTLGASETVTLRNLTVAGDTSSSPVIDGGGILLEGGGSLVMNDCTVRDTSIGGAVVDNRYVGHGGGIAVYGSLTATDCTFTNNNCDGSGGAVYGAYTALGYGDSVIHLTRCVIEDGNAQYSGGGAFGGGSVFTMTDCIIRDCYGGFGSGLRLSSPGGVVTRCTFTNNANGGDGGGACVDEGLIKDCTFTGNKAAFGGGAWLGQSALARGCTFSGNIVEAYDTGRGGGGIFVRSGAIVTNCTVSGNSAPNGGGVFIQSSATLTNCTITANVATIAGRGGGVGGGEGGTGEFTLLPRNCIISGNTSAPSTVDDVARFSDSVPSSDRDDSVIGGDARLGPLANNGGPTLTHALLAGSPAINRGSNAWVQAPDFDGPPFLDQTGAQRIRGTADCGAVEELLTAVVSNTNDSGPGSLRDALTQAAPDVAFDAAVFGTTLQTITLTSGPIVISGDKSLTGPAPGVRISGGLNSRIFTVTAGNVDLRHIRIIDGSATGDGGGLRVLGGRVTLTDTGVSNCTASSSGGGIYVNSGTLIATDTTISGNTAASGGGIHADTAGWLNITNSTVSGNSATGSGGGALIAGDASQVTFINCTFTDNTADSDANETGDGGGLRRLAGAVNVQLGNTIIGGNNDLSSATSQPNVSGIFASLGHNLISNSSGSGSFVHGTLGDIVGSAASPVLPRLGPLQQNPAASPTRVHPLLGDSPAINAGDDGLLASGVWPRRPAHDERGQKRSVGTAVDIGAVEWPNGDVVNLTAPDSQASEQGRATGTFRVKRNYTDSPLTVHLNIDAASTASASDYSLSSGTAVGASGYDVTFAAGQDTVNISLTPANDQTVEGTETVSLTLLPGANYEIEAVAVNTRVVNILDNEFTVTDPGDSGPETLRNAIEAANAGGGGKITIPSALTITLGGTPLTISSAIEIVGNISTINAAGLSRVIDITSTSSGTAVLRGLVITGGRSPSDEWGGGIRIRYGCQVEIRGCSITGNIAERGGGGIYTEATPLTILNTAIDHNSALGNSGGGLSCSGVYTTIRADLTNVTVAANDTVGGGGGISVDRTNAKLTNCTITRNLSDSTSYGSVRPGGIESGLNAKVRIANTAITGNEDTPGNTGKANPRPDVGGSGTFVSLGYNFIGRNNGAVGDFPVGSPNANQDYAGNNDSPLDAGLVEVPGVRLHYRFPFTSLLRDQGLNSANTETKDQRGYDRIFNTTTDIGAVEMDFLQVTNANASNAGSLRDMIATANTIGHGSIVFDPAFFNVARTIALGTTGELAIAVPASIEGPSMPLTVSGSGQSRVFKVESGAGAVAFRNFTIQQGDTASHAANDRSGAGVLVGINADLSLEGMTLRTCDASASGGAAAVSVGGSLTASSCTFAQNQSDTQGGAIVNFGTLTLERSTLALNRAAAEGGAIANAGTAVLTNCTLSANRADSHGGAVFILSPAIVDTNLTHCTITANRSNDDGTGGGDGGGLRQVAGSVNVLNTIISGNDSVGGTHSDISGTFNSRGHNLVGIIAGGSGFLNGVNGDLVGANPHLGPLRNNGGATFTHALPVGSAAIDAAEVIQGSTDQRGLARGANPPDMGAYELLTETYDYWAAHTFPGTANAGVNQDHDGDGYTNSFEFGAGSDPLDRLSIPVVTPSRSGGNIIVDFTASPLAPLRYDVLRYSTDLLIWQDVPGGLYQIVGANPVQNTILYRVTIPTAFAPKLFLRLERLP